MPGQSTGVPRRLRYWVWVSALPVAAAALVLCAAIAGGHVQLRALKPLVPADGRSTLIVFGDYACPACARYDQALTEALEPSGPVRVEYHHFPLETIHPNALLAACAAEAARDHDKFPQAHAYLYQHQSEWAPLSASDARTYMIKVAADFGISETTFARAIDNPEVRRRVANDQALGVRLKVRGTPTFYLNGVEIRNLPSTSHGIRRFFQLDRAG